MRERIGPVIVVACAALIAVWAYCSQGIWELWAFGSFKIPFVDLRMVTAAWDSIQQGFDLTGQIPLDPLKRPMNYPWIWETPGYLGLTSRSTVALGFSLWGCFFLSAWFLLDKTRARSLFALPLLLSPAVMLGLERGNVDLAFFALAVLIAVLLPRSPLGSAFLIFLGFALKIYPAALSALILRTDRKPRALFLFLCAVIVLLGLVNWADLLQVRANTPTPMFWAYGINCFYLRYGSLHPQWGVFLRLAQGLMVVAPFAAARFVNFGRIARSGLAQRAFFSGALIYCFTFLLGANFDYRLLFLLLCVPLLSRPGQGIAPYARVGILALIIIASWSMKLEALAHQFFGPQEFAYLFTQTAKWLLFVCLAAMLLQERWDPFRGIRPKTVHPAPADSSIGAAPQSV